MKVVGLNVRGCPGCLKFLCMFWKRSFHFGHVSCCHEDNINIMDYTGQRKVCFGEEPGACSAGEPYLIVRLHPCHA